MSKKRCELCKKVFDPRTTWQKFCDPLCRIRGYRRRAAEKKAKEKGNGS